MLVVTAGRLSDLFGRKQAYVLGFAVFSLTSLGAGFAADGTQLLIWRALQGVGAAFLFANSSALVTDAFPKEQLGLAMGTGRRRCSTSRSSATACSRPPPPRRSSTASRASP